MMLGPDDLWLFNEGRPHPAPRAPRCPPGHRRRRGRGHLVRGLGPERPRRVGARPTSTAGAAESRRSPPRATPASGPDSSPASATAIATSTASSAAPTATPSTRPTPSPSGPRCRRAPRRWSGRSTATSGATTTGWPTRATANALDAPMSIYELHLGSWRHAPNELRSLNYRELAPVLRDYVLEHGLHPRRVPAPHGAPVLRLVGLPDDRLLRPDVAVRHPAGPHVPDRHPAPGRHRGDPRLGAVALPDRRARPRLLRRHPPLRARRPPEGPPPRLGQRDLQLRPLRGPQLPAVERPLLARPLPRRRPAGRRRGLDALPRLLPQGGGVDPQRARRQREPRRPAVPEEAERERLRRLPRRADHRRGVDRVADGVAPDRVRRARVRHEVGHGVDARHRSATSSGSRCTAASTRASSPSGWSTPSPRTSACR